LLQFSKVQHFIQNRKAINTSLNKRKRNRPRPARPAAHAQAARARPTHRRPSRLARARTVPSMHGHPRTSTESREHCKHYLNPLQLRIDTPELIHLHNRPVPGVPRARRTASAGTPRLRRANRARYGITTGSNMIYEQKRVDRWRLQQPRRSTVAWPRQPAETGGGAPVPTSYDSVNAK
jgi:hypothetical protein